jgi:hypothetical protein
MHVGLFFICKSVGGLPLPWTADTQEQEGATAVPAGFTSTLLAPLSKCTGFSALTLAPLNTLLNIGYYVAKHALGR